jgi:serine protease Do
MKRRLLPVCVAAITLAAITVPGPAAENNSRKSPIVLAVKKTRDSVVTVKGPRKGLIPPVGSGVIVDERGFVVTNAHVVGDAARVQVRLANGSTVEAQVLAIERDCDLAVLRLKTDKKLPALKLGKAQDLMVGETVIAIGNPFGYTNTVSTGIISALDRELGMPSGIVLTGLIQTDASINPGNSGGALINMDSELIGINVALRDGARGIAFAINAGTVQKVLAKHLNPK